MDIHGGTARTTVVTEQDRTVSCVFDIRTKIGIRENRCDWFAVFVIEDIVLTDRVIRNLFSPQCNLAFCLKAGRLELISLDCFSSVHFFFLLMPLSYSH